MFGIAGQEVAVILRELMERVKDLPPETVVCTAEVDEAFAVNIADVEVVDQAKLGSRKADGTESIDLNNGNERVVVIRW
jgi:hypothetical protein